MSPAMFPFTGALLEIDLGPLMPYYLSEIIAGILLMWKSEIDNPSSPPADLEEA